MENEFKQNSNGFHRSMQVWQALAVVTHELARNKAHTKSKLFDAGQTLGRLDYDKNADHWRNCKAFKKDANGKGWINATGGGRTFRDKIAEYFIDIV
ncbi:hypothetical protein VIBRN418_00320 [Vibrio sp. N418]|uniref:hypothetical protein n=1 Tax=Vibrio sp. (strain N418) TaxID=701176 RepID=UPI00021BDEEF|nr:hypothetical protein [Vibrio sp. N418]EGU35387.1 hypothetical protein VIBRN418_00320 [Vibrio sp. N418]